MKQGFAYDPIAKIVYDRACKGCVYLSRCGNLGCCNYIFIEGKRRPCPPSKACTVKTKKKRRAEK